MASVNKVILVGNVGADPEVRYMPNGDAACSITIATSEQWKDKVSGEKKERTEWHRCEFFGKLAETVGEYVKKGSSLYVEGMLRTDKWTDKEGVERYTTKVRCSSMQMLGGKEQAKKPENKDRPPKESGGDSSQKSSFDDMDDDIPFLSCAVEHDIVSSLERRMRKYG